MRARTRIDAASYDPSVVKAMGEAFDQAWGQIAANVGSDARSVDAARMKLADAVLAVATATTVDVDTLRGAALLKLAQDNPGILGSPPQI